MITAMIALEVLRKTMGGQVIPEGRRLYVALASMGRVVLAEYDSGVTDDWLELQGCVAHDFVLSAPDKVVAANGLRREGYAVDMVVVADPQEAVALIGAGFNTLLFTHSEYAIPAWRPDTPKGIRAWDDIVTATAEQAKLKAADKRLRGE